MKIITYVLALFLAGTTAVFGQDKQITLGEIWDGTFAQERMVSLNSLQNGTEYVVLNQEESSSSIGVFEYRTGERKGSLVDSENLKEISRFDSFELSEDESKVLLGTEREKIYRRSSRSIYYVYDISSESLVKVSEHKIQEPTFSPDATKVAYVYENNIYIRDLVSGEETQVTTDGEKNKVINGLTDWVYEEEFAVVRAFDWNSTGTQIGFLKFNETEVPEFSMMVYRDKLYPEVVTFKYPKAGEENAYVSLHLYNLNDSGTAEINLGDYEDFYIPRLEWTNDPAVLSVQVLNRDQNDLDLIFVNSEENEANVVLNETDEAYVDIKDDLTFLPDNSFIWTSEKDGWNHIYYYDSDGNLDNQVTKGNWVVTNYYGFDPETNNVFYQSTENGNVNRDVYSIKIDGSGKQRLTERAGMNSADFSADFTYFINSFTNTATPYQYTLHDAETGEGLRTIVDNEELLEKEKAYDFSPKELSTIEINGNELNMYMIKPSDFDADKEYPLLMFQYSGPGSQTVSNSYYNANEYWYQLLADEGYIVAAVDGRGTGYKGAEFKKVTQYELGKYELEDQIDAAKLFGSYGYINENRIGIWGWSYGGFMSSNAILTANDVFSMAIAVAPVTSWRFYDTIYTERYMGTPQENPDGYDDNSPLSHVEKLEGNYLLVHGSADDNVHLQNTMRLIDALVKENKEFDWAIYPDKDHGITGENARLQLYTKMTKFIKENL